MLGRLCSVAGTSAASRPSRPAVGAQPVMGSPPCRGRGPRGRRQIALCADRLLDLPLRVTCCAGNVEQRAGERGPVLIYAVPDARADRAGGYMRAKVTGLAGDRWSDGSYIRKRCRKRCRKSRPLKLKSRFSTAREQHGLQQPTSQATMIVLRKHTFREGAVFVAVRTPDTGSRSRRNLQMILHAIFCARPNETLGMTMQHTPHWTGSTTRAAR